MTALTRIAIVGGGQVALLAAAALARALPLAEITVIAVAVDSAALADAAHTTQPSLARLLGRIGLPERLMLERALASHRLAVRYKTGHSAAADFAVGYGGLDPGGGSIAALIAEQGGFAMPADDPASPLSDIDYAVRFDPVALFAGLTALANSLRIRRIPALTIRVVRDETGAVTALVLPDTEAPITADLYIDCSGPARWLTSPDVEWIDWRGAVPIDRVALLPPAPPALVPLDTWHGFAGGYALVSPGRDQTRRLLCWNAATLSDREASDVAERLLGSAPLSADSLAAGQLAQPWAGNCIALGDAAAVFDPAGWTNLHFAQIGIELLLELLPRTGNAPAERAEYNRRATLAAARIADYAALHSVTQPWVKGCHPSPSLARTIAGYTRRGIIAAFEEETIAKEQWRQLLRGLLGTQTPVEVSASSKLAAANCEPYALAFAALAGAPRRTIAA